MSKYHNRKVALDGFVFDSVKEARRYQDLKLLEATGEIHSLERQVKFNIDANWKHICVYYADFVYETKEGKQITEDVKGMRTPMYRLKKKLVEALYGIEITEV